MGNGRQKPVLIVEDETILRESLRDWLTEDGYQVETAKDGEEGSKAIAENNFGVVLLDLKLPKKDGIEVLREAKALKPDLKTIIITAYPSVQTAVQALKEGAVDYLPKPINLENLQKLIDGTLVPDEKPAGYEAVAKLAVEQNAEDINVSLVGWEYIDYYLFHKKESAEK